MSTDFIRKVMTSVNMKKYAKMKKNMKFLSDFRPDFQGKKKEFETS